jgi:predicted Zn-dependent peptidase
MNMKKRSLLTALACWLAACHPTPPTRPIPPPAEPSSLSELSDGASVHGFAARALYLDDQGRPRGARLLHARTGFVLDYLVIEAVPQAFVWAHTLPVSDRGESHAQEHLLVGQGNKGRFVQNYDQMHFAEPPAGTGLERTSYRFGSVAGLGTFWGLFENHLDSLVHPDYTDADIRRETRNFGVKAERDGSLTLDERGTVYNEMMSTWESVDHRLYAPFSRALFGAAHPFGRDCGGTPEGLRQLQPADIRAYHAAHYRLDNMGAIVSLPSSVALPTMLDQIGGVLDRISGPGDERAKRPADPPPPTLESRGSLQVVDYPAGAETAPASALLGWALPELSFDDEEELRIFMHAFASGADSPFHQMVVDPKTRAIDLGATDTSGGITPEWHLIELNASGIAAGHANQEGLVKLRDLIHARLSELASLPPGSPQLRAFAERWKARVAVERRAWRKRLETSPQFASWKWDGFWIDHLVALGREPGFKKSLTAGPLFDRALALAEARDNPWRERLARWGLLLPPTGILAKASPALRQKLDEERAARVAAELQRLEASYGTTDAKTALQRRQAEIQKAEEEQARIEAAVKMPPLASDPPMTSDDTLQFSRDAIDGVPALTSTVETMASATYGLALRLDGVEPRDLPLVAILPSLLEEVGVVEGGKRLSNDEVLLRLRHEVLRVSLQLSTRFSTDRAELVLEGSGNDAEETKSALAWMRRFLVAHDWSRENLPRLREVARTHAAELGETMQGPDYQWLFDAAEPYYRSQSPLLFHTGAFLTRWFDAVRLCWLLEGANPALVRWIASLGPAGAAGRSALTTLLGALTRIDSDDKTTVPPALARHLQSARALPPSARPALARLGSQLGLLLGGVPDATLAHDWAELTAQLARDAATDPQATLAALDRVLAAVLHRENARLFVVGARKTQSLAAPELSRLLAALPATPASHSPAPARSIVDERLRARGATGGDREVVALVRPEAQRAAIEALAPGPGLDTDGDPLIDVLAAAVLAGAGNHSIYKRVWTTGLAYSGAVWPNPKESSRAMFMVRSPDLPLLLGKMDAAIRATHLDPALLDYAKAQLLSSRSDDEIESRVAAMAADFADGLAPERVRGFRSRLLALRSDEATARRVQERLTGVLGTLFPTLTPTAPIPRGAAWFMMGPEPQVDAYEKELRAARGPNLSVRRLYPRDFWDLGKAPN